MIGGLGRIARQQPLIEPLILLQGRFVTQQHFDELERLDVASKHNQAHREGRRQQESDRPPQQSPEHRGYYDSQRRQAGMLAIEKRFDKIAGECFRNDKQRRHDRNQSPARVDGGRQRHR